MGFGPPVGEILRIVLAPTSDCADADAAAWLLPSAAHLTSAVSGTTLATDLTVVNPTSRDGGFSVSFLGHDRDGTTPLATKSFSLAAGATVTYRDLLPSVFGTADGWGAVEVRSDVPDLVVQSRTLALAGAGSVGSTLPAFGAGDLLRTDQVATIASVDEDAGTRTNLLLANATGAETDVDIRLVTADGRAFGPMRVRLLAKGMAQVNRVASALGATGEVSGAYVMLTSPTPDAAYAAAATAIDNHTQDTRVLLPR